jgi:hypothetical protein
MPAVKPHILQNEITNATSYFWPRLQNQWNEAYAEEIKSTVESRVQEGLRKYKPPAINVDRKYLIEVEKERLERDVRAKVAQEYQQKYEKYQALQVQGINEHILYLLKLLEDNNASLLTQIQTLHPWLSNSGIDRNLVQNLLLTQLLNDAGRYDGKSWVPLQSMTLQDFQSKTLSWMQNPEQLKGQMSEYLFWYPLTERNDMITHLGDSVISGIPDQTLKTKPHEVQFKQLDVLRLLYKLSPREGLSTRTLTAMGTQELSVHLKKLPRPNREIIALNCGAEDSPFWIILSWSQNRWKAFVPAKQSQSYRAQLQSVLPNTPIVEIDYQANLQQNDIQGFHPDLLWHAVLFARVLPCVVNNNSNSHTQLETCPLPILLQVCFSKVVAEFLVKKAFRNRFPITAQTFFHGVRSAKLPQGEEKESEYCSPSWMIGRFASGNIKISKNLDTVIVSCHTSGMFQEAIRLFHHYPNLSRLEYHSHIFAVEEDLAGANTHLKSVHLIDMKGSVLDGSLRSIAARNCFLASYTPALLKEEEAKPLQDRKLWDITAAELMRFFCENAASFDVNVIERLLPWRKHWFNNNCDHRVEYKDEDQEQKPNALVPFNPQAANFQKQTLDPSSWAFLQIAQMGIKGLDVFFNHLERIYGKLWSPKRNEDPPNIPLIFDLSGTLNSLAQDYIKTLGSHIERLAIHATTSSPLLRSLSLILPQPFDSRAQDEFLNLLKILNTHRLSRPKEFNELVLFNLDVNDIKFLEKLLSWLAKPENESFQIQIRLPEWDRAALPKSEIEFKTRNYYRQIQNKIVENQQKIHAQALAGLRPYLDEEKKGPIYRKKEEKEDQKEEKEADQFWGEEIWYPLGTQTLGLQQALQDEAMLNQEEEEEEEQEQEQDQEQEQQQALQVLLKFEGSESDLITRHNIGNKCADVWRAIPNKTKQLSGIAQTDSLADLFSIWVGSDSEAPYVIRKMQVEAVQKIMEFAPFFRFGIDLESLPAGFYLANGGEGLILCFNKEREKQDLLEEAQKKQPDPFKLRLVNPLLRQTLCGDYRQFVNDYDPGATLWKYLAEEDNDPIRMQRAEEALQTSGLHGTKKDASVAKQGYEVSKKWELAKDKVHCLQSLNALASQSKEISESLRSTLFDNHNSLCLTEENLKSLGQCVNHYGKQGFIDIFHLASKVLEQAPMYFATWKTYYLDPTVNWTQCLDLEEVQAITASLRLLKERPDYQAIWWALVKKQSEATGCLRYAPLWASFQKLTQYLEKHRLNLDPKLFAETLDKYPNFQGQTFLAYIYRTLRQTENQVDRRAIMQSNLDNLPQIGWRYNEFYYASRWNKHPLWQESLAFKEFKRPDDKEEAAYEASWEASLELTDPILQALRFASIHGMLENFSEYEQLLRSNFGEEKSEQQVAQALRLLSACRTLGIDSLQTLQAADLQPLTQRLLKIDSALLLWANQILHLTPPFLRQSLQMRFADLTIFFEEIKKQGPEFQQKLLSLKGQEGLDFINACGRALRAYQGNDPSLFFGKLLTSIEKQSDFKTLPPLFSHFPWLIENYQGGLETKETPKELLHFQKQLQSIHFEKKPKLPTEERLKTCYQEISTAADPALARRKAVKALNQEHCQIRLLDEPFRKLTHDEIVNAMAYLAKRLQTPFKATNQKLCHKLLEQHLAIKRDQESEQLIKDFLHVLLRLDHQLEYDELGRVLGLLLSKARPDKHYSLSHLMFYFQKLQQDLHVDAVYPLNLLREILSVPAIEDGSSPLLNQHLGSLTEVPDKYNSLGPELTKVVDLKIPSHFKNVLIQLVLSEQQDFTTNAIDVLVGMEKNGQSLIWKKAVLRLIGNLKDQNISLKQKIAVLHQLSQTLPKKVENNRETLTKLWQDTQIKWINWYCAQPEHAEALDLREKFDCFEQMIFTHSMNMASFKYVGAAFSIMLSPEWNSFNPQEKSDLAAFYASNPPISEETFKRLVHSCHRFTPHLPEAMGYPANEAKESKQAGLDSVRKTNCANKVEYFIFQFEAVEQALDDKRKQKRKTLLADDAQRLPEILSSIARKNKDKGFLPENEQLKLMSLLAYSYSYAQEEDLEHLTPNALAAQIDQEKRALIHLIQKISAIQKDLDAWNPKTESERASKKEYTQTILQKLLQEKEYAATKLLACLRELGLRKSGLWLDHTQMLVLLYAQAYEKENVIVEMDPGAGKSFTFSIWFSYRALLGITTDVFSEKESLLQRDCEEFSSQYKALKIAHTYLTPDSEVPDLKSKDENTEHGGINYCSAGSLALFLSKYSWESNEELVIDPENREAFFDELDYVLRDETTQFNFADSLDTEGAYNPDEWVYRAVYEFYLEHVGTFTDPKGRFAVSNVQHLQPLCNLLLQRSKEGHSPNSSQFLAKFIFPAAKDKNATNQAIRDQSLFMLLMAADRAHHFKAGVNYSVGPHLKEFKNSLVTREGQVAKVVIAAQVRPGARYSNLVHQFLHVILNHKKRINDEEADFEVDKPSEILLQQNVLSLAAGEHLHRKKGGCTASTGDERDLASYEKSYKISHVVRFEPHEPSQSEYLPPIFCQTEEEQIQALVNAILSSTNRPMLIVCEDDDAVKNLAAKLQTALQAHHCAGRLFIDTNDSGKREKAILPLIAKSGVVTLSARLGRGSNPKPESEEGLFVVGSYPCGDRRRTQRQGRQGRKGAKGTYQEIFCYGPVEQAYQSLMKSQVYQAPLQAILQEQEQALEKERQANPRRFAWAKDDKLRQAHLICCSYIQFEQEQKEKNERYRRRKEELQGFFSTQIERALQKQIKEKKDKTNIKETWAESKGHIETLWAAHMCGEQGETEAGYQAFEHAAIAFFKSLSAKLQIDVNNFQSKIFYPHKAFSPQEEKEEKKEEDIVAQPQTNNEDVEIDDEYLFKDKDPKDEAQLIQDHKNQALKLYQHLFKKVNEDYFSGHSLEVMRREIYAGNGQAAFYQALQEASCHPNKERVIRLFHELSRISFPAVSFLGLSYLIRALIPTLDATTANFDFTLVCLQHLSDSPWFKQDLSRLKPAEITKTSLIIPGIVVIFCNLEEEDPRVFQWIDCFCQLLSQENWKELTTELLQDMFRIINAAPEWFSLHASRDDLKHLIDLLKLSSSNKKQYATHGLRISTLCEYLDENRYVMNPLQIRSLLTLSLYPLNTISEAQAEQAAKKKPEEIVQEPETNEEKEMYNYLPPQRANRQFLKEEAELCAFLCLRMPILEEDYNTLAKLFEGMHYHQDFREEVFLPLIQLAPHIHLRYILNYLTTRNMMSKWDHSRFKAELSPLREAAEYFNQVLCQKGLIKSQTVFRQVSEATPEFDYWLTFFHSMPVEKNLFLFDTLRRDPFNRITLETIKTLSQSVDLRSLPNEQLLSCLTILANYPQWTPLLLEQLAQKDKWPQIQNMLTFLTKHFQTINHLALNHQEVNFLLESSNEDLSTDFARLSKILEQISTSSYQALWSQMKTDCLTKQKTLQQSRKLQQKCLQFLDDIKKTSLTDEEVLPLWARYQKEMDVAQWKTHLEMVDEAKQDQGTYWKAYFEEKQEEPLVKKAVVQELFFGEGISAEMQAAMQQQYYKRITESKMESYKGDRSSHQNVYKEYQRWSLFAKNRSQEAKYPQVNADPIDRHFTGEQQNLFQELTRLYASFRGVSSYREAQAQNWLRKLNALTQNRARTKTQFYLEVIRITCLHQTTLLSDDHQLRLWFRQVNSKGHSRLYDLMTQTILRYGSEYLSTEHSTAALHQHLKPHLISHITMLQNRLSNIHPFNAQLDQVKTPEAWNDSEAVSTFMRALDEFKRLTQKGGPLEHLNYLVDSISALAPLMQPQQIEHEAAYQAEF